MTLLPSNPDRVARMRRIQEGFLARVTRDLDEAEELAGADPPGARDRVASLLHALKGAAGSCGFEALGAQVAALAAKFADGLQGELLVGALEELRSVAERCEPTGLGSTTQGVTQPVADPRGVLLCIEDDPDIALLVQFAGELAGFEVEVCSNGQAGWSRLESGGAPAVVLLDLMLPGVSGFEVLKRARSTPGLAELPIIVLSARVLEGERARAMSAGASAFLAKPFDVDDLAALVGSLQIR
ncbi:MAG: response regulator [Planctomycetota bacterium]